MIAYCLPTFHENMLMLACALCVIQMKRLPLIFSYIDLSLELAGMVPN